MALMRRAAVMRVVGVALLACLAEAGPADAQSGAGRLLGLKRYEYDERVDLSLNGSAIVDVNGSLAALVALRGAALDVDPEARFDRQAVRQLFEGPGVTVREISAFRRDGRRFAHVRLEVDDIRQLPQVPIFSWSRYQLDLLGDEYRFVQDVGTPAQGGATGAAGWTGDELVAFRLHLPSKINFHNSPERIERGNILAWEQPLHDRLAGSPLHMEARMETESILYRTLFLFGATFAAAMLVLAFIAWLVMRKGKSQVRIPNP